MELEIAVRTRSDDAIEALKKVPTEGSLSIERNITGEVIVVLTVSIALAKVVIAQVGRVVESGQATIRSRTIKSQKGTITISGYTAEEAIAIVEALKSIDDG